MPTPIRYTSNRVRTVCGTEWPHTAIVQRHGRRWVLTQVCNSLAESATAFRTRRAACAHAEALGYSRI